METINRRQTYFILGLMIFLIGLAGYIKEGYSEVLGITFGFILILLSLINLKGGKNGNKRNNTKKDRKRLR